MRVSIDETKRRAWLEYVVETAIDMLDAMDAAGEDLEDDELGDEPEDRRVA